MAAFANRRATQLPEASSLEKLRGIFQKCDLDSNGRINKREFIKVIRNNQDVAHFFGLPMQIHQEDGSRDKMEKTFQQIDVNSDREITWEEFLAFYTKLQGSRDVATARSRSNRKQQNPQTSRLARRATAASLTSPLHVSSKGRQQLREPRERRRHLGHRIFAAKSGAARANAATLAMSTDACAVNVRGIRRMPSLPTADVMTSV